MKKINQNVNKIPMNKIIAVCRGGLSNRLNNLVNSIYLSEKTGYKLLIYWPRNNRCYCHFSELFENVLQDADLQMVKNCLLLQYSAWNNEEISKIISQVLSTKKIVAINNPVIFSGIKSKDKKRILSNLYLKPNIQKMIDDFVHKHNINKSFTGIHIRGTDFGNTKKTKKEILSIIKKEVNRNKQKKYFLCSDERKIEEYFYKMFPDNIVINHKGSAYIRKKALACFLPWNTNRLWRSKESVEMALMDIHILSKTNIKYYSKKSTFSHIALILSGIDKKIGWKQIIEENAQN